MKVSEIIRFLAVALLLVSLASCQKEYEVVATVFRSGFEADEPTVLDNIPYAQFLEYDNSRMLGVYHNGGFEMHFVDLPDHDLLRIDFDLYIIDSWDGNKTSVSGPDRWFMESRREWTREEPASVDDFLYETSFSNAGDPEESPCLVEFGCSFQSYPGRYPSSNLPRTGIRRRINGFCHFDDLDNGTSVYRISQTIVHNFNELHLFFYDSLVQVNTQVKPCDESWALDNLTIRAIAEN